MSDMVHFEKECGFPGNSHMSEPEPPRKIKKIKLKRNRHSTIKRERGDICYNPQRVNKLSFFFFGFDKLP